MIALDLFAGTGWGVACQRLGIEEMGVEIMPEAQATRQANGMFTLYSDVWEGLTVEPDVIDAYENVPGVHSYNGRRWVVDYDLLIASPPCQTFSMAGKGAGRQALDDVLEAIRERAYLDPAKLRERREHDPRTALVLTPLAHVARDLPLHVVFEQVPPVLPVWEACAAEMRRWGYSVWVGIVNAEQYGVPQTRRRAILIARADGREAKAPTPTHSRYYSRDPKRLDEGVLPWVSMAEALGWGGGESMRTNQGNPREGYYEREDGAPSPTVTGIGSRSWNRVMRSNYGTGGDPAARGERAADTPAPTMTSKADRNQWHLDPEKPATTVAADPRLSSRDHHEHGAQAARATRVTVAEAAALQSYPEGFEFAGAKTKQFLQIGNAVPPLLAEAILREVTS